MPPNASAAPSSTADPDAAQVRVDEFVADRVALLVRLELVASRQRTTP